MRRMIAAGNWKMHGTLASARALLGEVASGLDPRVTTLVFPPSVQIEALAREFDGRGIGFGGQDLSVHGLGAYTGEVSGAMLADVGATHVLVGHSERREYHEESSDLVAEKLIAARRVGLVPILCVGESLHQREAGQTEWALSGQIAAVLKRGGIPARDHTGAPVNPTRVVANLVFWFVLFTAMLVSADALGIDYLGQVFSELVSYVPSVIAAVVIGGTLLTGGVGYVAGTALGVGVLGLIQTLITFQGTLNSWWARIAVGAV